MWFNGGLGSIRFVVGRFVVGLDGLRSLFQRNDSMIATAAVTCKVRDKQEQRPSGCQD